MREECQPKTQAKVGLSLKASLANLLLDSIDEDLIFLKEISKLSFFT